ncbi:ElyC/SanA/YdcF family protein [Psychromonas ossibalaenae]|uniref:ElyC/SanA/YdcF family protein n=1 Tax=Psychromonas ossibalaenae TaxID=444922 RepID=UPI000366F3D4|nr:ElyC/SanA/YdcF family protein [Psychromonas ossibalaenae]
MKKIRALSLSLITISLLSACNNDETIINEETIADADIVIGLGLQVNYASCSPRLLLESRVDRLYLEGSKKENPLYVVSGKGNPTSVPLCVEGEVATDKTEAGAMRDILMSKYSVPEDQILLEEESTDTVTNAAYVKELLDEKVRNREFIVQSYTLVTSNYHMHRGGAGNDSSAPYYFNNEFGADTFVEGENTFESTIIDNESVWTQQFTNSAGWVVNQDVRTAADINGDGKADAVGFQAGSVYADYSNGSSQFEDKVLLTDNFLPAAGSWTAADYRTTADINGDGKAELIGFAGDGVYVASAANNYQAELWTADFASDDGWTAERHVYQMQDMNDNGKADIVAFGEDGVYVAYAEDGKFGPMHKYSEQFGATAIVNGSEDGHDFASSLTQYLRLAGDVTGNGYPDAVIFGADAIYVAENNGTEFSEAKAWLGPETDEEGNHASFIDGWDNADHYRGLADMNGNGRSDIVTIGNKDVVIAHSTGERFEHLNGVWSYTTENRHNDENDLGWHQFTKNVGWSGTNSVRVFADVTGSGIPDLIGFYEDNVYTAISVAH